MNAMRRYRAAKSSMERSQAALAEAKLTYGKMRLWWQEARIEAALSLPCPFCHAGPMQSCVWQTERHTIEPLHQSRFDQLESVRV